MFPAKLMRYDYGCVTCMSLLPTYFTAGIPRHSHPEGERCIYAEVVTACPCWRKHGQVIYYCFKYKCLQVSQAGVGEISFRHRGMSDDIHDFKGLRYRMSRRTLF